VKTKWNLTKSEQRAHSANSERLKSGGVAIGVEKTASSESPLLRIDQGDYSFIYAGARKGIALALCVRLTVLKPGITIRDYEITIPGCDDVNIFLVEPPEGSLSYKVFGWLGLETGAVLNGRILSGRPLPCDRILDGFVVAQSFDSLPSRFQTGMRIDATICLADQSDNLYTSVVELIVERYPQEGAHTKKGNGLIVPKQVIGARHQRQVQEASGGCPKPMGGIVMRQSQGGPAARSRV
jgi:hypothetical protein